MQLLLSIERSTFCEVLGVVVMKGGIGIIIAIGFIHHFADNFGNNQNRSIDVVACISDMAWLLHFSSECTFN
jgi:hypothetical protein